MSTRLHGIDISNYQAGLKLANTDAQFVMIKATEGVGYTDPYCDGFVQQAKKLGLPWGTYHFYAGGDGKAEADHYLDAVGGYLGHGILCLDFERNTGNRSEPTEFLNRILERTGIAPVLYISGSVATAGNWGSVPKTFPLWIARWGTSDPGATGPWDFATLWQYTDAHSTGGMRVDGDYFYGDHNAWAAIAGGSSDAHTDTDTDDSSSGTDTGGDSHPDGQEDLDMAKHVKMHRTTNQKIKKADPDNYQWLFLDEDDHTSVSIVPAKISGLLYLEVSGLTPKDSLNVYAGSYDVKKKDSGNEWTPRTENKPDRLTGEEGGWVHRSIPVVWDLGDQDSGWDYRCLRFMVASNTTNAVIENCRFEGWVTEK